MKKMQITSLKNGRSFRYGGIEWIKLGSFYNTMGDSSILAITKDGIEQRSFDPLFRNWPSSDLRHYLNNDFLDRLIANGANRKNFMTWKSKLIAIDGMSADDFIMDKIVLLSYGLYCTHREIIPEIDGVWWLVSPWTYQEKLSHITCAVLKNGVISDFHKDYIFGYVRPVCFLDPSTIVFIEVENIQDIEFTLSPVMPSDSTIKIGAQFTQGTFSAADNLDTIIGDLVQKYKLNRGVTIENSSMDAMDSVLQKSRHIFCDATNVTHVYEWVKKAYEESRIPGTTIAMYLPARTNTKYFHDYIFYGRADEIIFLKNGRKMIKYGNYRGKSAPLPTAIVVWRSPEQKEG